MRVTMHLNVRKDCGTRAHQLRGGCVTAPEGGRDQGAPGRREVMLGCMTHTVSRTALALRGKAVQSYRRLTSKAPSRSGADHACLQRRRPANHSRVRPADTGANAWLWWVWTWRLVSFSRLSLSKQLHSTSIICSLCCKSLAFILPFFFFFKEKTSRWFPQVKELCYSTNEPPLPLRRSPHLCSSVEHY